MKNLTPIIYILAILVLILLGVSNSLPHSESETQRTKVIEVIDGDTIKIRGNIRVRLSGIDSPEKSECYYQEAKEELENLIEDKVIRLDKDIRDTDRYDRLLRYVILEKEGEDNLLVNDYLVRQGFAFDIASPPNNRYRDLFSSASEEAKRESRGLWQSCNYDQSNTLGETDSGPTDPDCIIKGNISEKGYGKTYLIPGCDNYNRVKIDTKKGEQYFCTEAQAISAGFRKATNCP